jgi:hypothetical protein
MAAERVLSAQTRTQLKKKIGIFEKPHSTILKQTRLTFTNTINRMVTMKVQLVKVNPELNEVAYSSIRRKVCIMMIEMQKTD